MRRLPPVLADVVRIDRSKLAFDAGVRGALGISVVLVAGELSGHPAQGVTAAVGAINGGFASLQGTYRTRAAVVLGASVGTALAAFVGMMVGHQLLVNLVVTGAIGFVAGLLVALGPASSVVGVQTVVGLVVFSQFSFPALVAVREAALILGGECSRCCWSCWSGL